MSGGGGGRPARGLFEVDTRRIESIINEKIRELSNVKDSFENDKLMEENQQLKERNGFLEKRNTELETGKVKPFTLKSFDPEVPLFELEKLYILNALKHFKGNKAKAANALGLTIKTLYNKLHMYGEL